MADFKALAVYCGSRVGTDPAHGAAAERLGRIMAERRVRLIFGGGSVGMIGVLADAVLDAGGEAVGVIPDFLLRYEVAHRDLTELMVVDGMHARKRRMFDLADGFIVLPGGLGTLDEMVEIVTWKQLGLHTKPIIVVDAAGYWAPFKMLLESVITGGFAHGSIANLLQIVPTVDDVFPALAQAPEPSSDGLASRL